MSENLANQRLKELFRPNPKAIPITKEESDRLDRAAYKLDKKIAAAREKNAKARDRSMMIAMGLYTSPHEK